MDTVQLDAESKELVIIDQTLLPNETKLLRLSGIEEIREAILSLRVRGAPAIGVAAAVGLYAAAERFPETSREPFLQKLREAANRLASARPTAVNLCWALNRMERASEAAAPDGVPDIRDALRREAEAILREDVETCRKIGEAGAPLLRDGSAILTHCNAGRLAAVRYGTALAPVYVAAERGVRVRVYADETRPLLQGARLTAWELTEAGIETTVLCDNMASSLMKSGKISAVFVGADRIAANGDTANKIGTSGVAVLAKHYGIPFYVCAPFSTIDPQCPDGDSIVIEQRAASEVRELWYSRPMVPLQAAIYNPAFDVTGYGLITGFVTERGVLSPPYAFQ